MTDSADTASSKNYAIMRFGRIADMNVLRRVSNHNTRAVISENVQPDGPAPRELLETGSDDFVLTAMERMSELGIDPASAKGKVLAIEAVVAASRDWFEHASDTQKKAWCDASVEWAEKKFGPGLLTAKLHEDEEVWHIHFVALPVVEKVSKVRGRKPKTAEAQKARAAKDAARPRGWTLAYTDLLGGRADRLSLEQDNYHAAVQHLGLERGERRPEVTDIHLGDGLTMPATDYDRGVDKDGKPKPRRHMRPSDYRARIKRMDAASAEALREADAMLLRTANAEAEAGYARDIAEADRAAAAVMKEAATAAATRMDADQQALAVRHDEADRAKAELENAMRERQLVLADHERAAAISRGVAEVDRATANRLRIDLEVAIAAAVTAREIAADEAARAMKQRIDTDRAKAAADAEASRLRIEREAFEAQQRRHTEQLALLVRAADDTAGLNLRPAGTTFAMITAVMSDEELATYNRPWTSAAIRIAVHLAQALTRVRELVRRLLLRETQVAAREAAVADGERANLAARVQHERALADLQIRTDSLKVAETEAARMSADASTKAGAAKVAEARAIATEAEQRSWIKVADIAAREPLFFRLGKDGLLDVDPAMASAGVVPPWLWITLDKPAPDWVKRAVTAHQALHESEETLVQRGEQVDYAMERLADMVDRLGPVLDQAQTSLVADAKRAMRDGAAIHPARSGADIAHQTGKFDVSR